MIDLHETWSEVSEDCYKDDAKDRCQNLEPIWRYQASNSQKSTQNRPKFMDDPKNFRKNFFWLTLPNGPIQKVIMLKVKFEDLRLHLPLWGHGSRFFDQKFFDQKKYFFQVSKWFNSQSHQVKIQPIMRASLLDT